MFRKQPFFAFFKINSVPTSIIVTCSAGMSAKNGDSFSKSCKFPKIYQIILYISANRCYNSV